MNIILCGLQSSGKTTVGQLLSLKLKKPFLDIDHLIESNYLQNQNARLSCRQIALTHGELFFRSLEKKAIQALQLDEKIIATGGGSLSDESNAIHLKSIGKLIYLKSDPRILWKRISPHGIPSYLQKEDPEKHFYSIAEKRIPIYEKFSDHTIDANNKEPDQIVNSIENLIYGLK